MSVGGLILAAGAASRFSEAGSRLVAADERAIKPQPGFREQPMLQWAIDAHCVVAELDRVLVVLGANADSIVRSLQLGRAEAAVCIDWDAGMSASLKLGMRALCEMERVIVTLADQPLIDAGLISRFVHEPAGTRAAYHGRPGHPVVLGYEHRSAIDRLDGDRGAGELLSDARLIECGEEATTETDTPPEFPKLV